MSTVVVYVHGLWLNGWEGAWLGRQLTQRLGTETRLFPYSSVHRDLSANVSALARYLAGIEADGVHLVGHSMGGSIIVELFERAAFDDAPADAPVRGFSLPPGRIVLLGPPLSGSRTAERVARLPYGRQILGLTAAEALLKPQARRWNRAREIGVIAGDLALGFGRLMGPLHAPSDGTVMVEETRLEGASDHITLKVSHSGMLFSAEVARQTAAFLRSGRFDP